MHELKTEEFERVRPLFQGFDYSLSIHAAIEGNNPGRIFVDDVVQPRTALALTVEGYLLAGDHEDPTTNAALRRLLKEKIFTGQVYVNGDWSMSLAVHPDAWAAKLPELIPTHEVEKNDRYHYLCRAVKFDWHDHIPQGYAVHPVDQAVLHSSHIVFPDSLRDWVDLTATWWAEENFLSKGVSFCITQENTVVAWCVSDCRASDRIDIGVITHPAHRRCGLASIAVAATVEHCLSHGFSAVGWHCAADNVASWKTAEKVGFEHHRTYAYYYYIYDPIDHLAELGWYHYKRGTYAKTVQYYEQMFALRDENPDYYYHLAASAYALLENATQALRYLQAAADHGWAQAEWIRRQEEFSMLHGTPEWKTVLARMENAEQEG